MANSSTGKSPAFQFYPADWLSDEHVTTMSLEEEGAYIRLLSLCWREGSLPANLEALSKLCKGASTTLLRVVANRFIPMPENDTRLIHKRLEAERLKQAEWRKKSSRGGKKSADKRRKTKDDSKGG